MEPVITKTELKNSFVKILTNLYFLKLQLKSYLPLLLAKATFKPLKLQIRETIININADLLRFEFIFKRLGIDSTTLISTLNVDVNLENHVIRNLEGLNFSETDMSILNHLLILEAIAASSFKLLYKQALLLHNKEIHDWIQEILKACISCKKKINELIIAYFNQ